MEKLKAGGNSGRVLIRYRNAVLLGCTALVAFAPLPVVAQDAAGQASGTVLETITVDGGGTSGDDDSKSIIANSTTGASKMPTDILDTAASVSVITAKEIQQRGADSIEQVLQYTPGITTDFYGADDRFDYYKIRGFDAWAYRDGLTLGDPFGGVREEPYAFERVEVLKGASSTAYGVSDPGGSVNYTTKRPKSEKFGEVYTTGGSYDHAEAGFDFGDNITEDDTLSYRLTGKFQKSDAEYDYSKDDEQFIMGGLTWRPTDQATVTLVYDHLDRDGVPGSGGYPIGTDFETNRFFGEPDFNYRGTDRDTVSLFLDHDFGTGLTFNSNLRYSNSETDFGYAYIASTPTDGSTLAPRYFYANDSTEETLIGDANFTYETSFANVESRTLVGATVNDTSSTSKSWWDLAPSIDWTNPVYTGAPTSLSQIEDTATDQLTKALYLEQDFTFSEKVIASFGLRNDWIDTTVTDNLTPASSSDGSISEFSKRVGLTYRFTEEFATYASYAESVAPPSNGVEPERGEQIEVGIKYRPDDFPAMFTAAVYDLTKTNITRTNPATMLEETIGEARVRGIDLEAKTELTHDLSLTAGYSYLVSEIVENGTQGNEGNELSLVPRQTASLWLNYTREGNDVVGDMTVGLGTRYIGEYFLTDENTSSSGDVFVFDASLAYKIQPNTTFELNVTNLFDEKYVAYGGFGADFYNPGRAIYATLRQTW
ncbi:TonB-dependent siderophore receptor [Rhizobium sp. CG5]|uniref:TonB-dependent siderophore receptor n=1 Tax=Rhizobium sp. CG5 TaxID=2726076 RepID=UPI002033549C|nr:TonB-dependent siderophore receptor [Rhizobium sp. CG5]MCM2477814.1 TonB-dependent siderophore receptor [Rhizobium sp. CG5]